MPVNQSRTPSVNLLNARKEVERIRLRDLSFGSEIATQTRQRSVTASRSHQMERAGGSIAPSTTRCLPIRCQTYGSSGVSCSFSRRPCRHPLLTASAAPAANRLTPMAPGPLPPNDGEARKSPRGAASARRNRTKHPSFDQHSRLCVAIERLSNWRRLLVGAPAVGPPKQGWAPADRPTLAPLSVEDESEPRTDFEARRHCRNSAQFVLRSTTISTSNVISSPAKSAKRDARVRWSNWARSWLDSHLEFHLPRQTHTVMHRSPTLSDEGRQRS